MNQNEVYLGNSTLSGHRDVMLSMLDELDRICRKNQIKYMLFAGTLLGAVREEGFIPWDDDLDVLMLREDYERFLSVAERELDAEKFFLQKEFSAEWPMMFSKLRKNSTTCLEKYHPKRKPHEGVYIDIFPCDNAYNSGLMKKLQFAASKIVIAKALDRRGYDTDSKKKKIFMGICRVIPQRPMLRLAKAAGKRDGEYVHDFFAASSSYRRSVFKREWFSELTEATFEGKRYPIPKHYDEILKTLYGDYMTPPADSEKEQKQHAILIDLEKSYEHYEHYRDDMKFDVYSRSIR